MNIGNTNDCGFYVLRFYPMLSNNLSNNERMYFVEEHILLIPECGDWMGDFFIKMVNRSQETNSDVYGLFNGILYVARCGIETADEVRKYKS